MNERMTNKDKIQFLCKCLKIYKFDAYSKYNN